MSTQPTPDGPKLPADVTEVTVIRQMLGVPPAVHHSVIALLAERGSLFAVQSGMRPSLAGHSDYLAALSEFCERVPAVAGSIREIQAHADHVEAHRLHQATPTAKVNRALGKKP